MTDSISPRTLRRWVLDQGHLIVPTEIDGQIIHLRYFKVALPDALVSFTSPPAADPHLAAAVDKTRHRIKKAIGGSSSIPISVVQALVFLHIYTGTPLSSTTDGLRLLLQVSGVDDLDWEAMVSVVAETSATPPLPPSDRVSRAEPASDDRIDRLEAAFNDMRLNLSRQIAEAVKATLAVTPPLETATTTPGPAP